MNIGASVGGIVAGASAVVVDHAVWGCGVGLGELAEAVGPDVGACVGAAKAGLGDFRRIRRPRRLRHC